MQNEKEYLDIGNASLYTSTQINYLQNHPKLYKNH